jgi:hypothetical protein
VGQPDCRFKARVAAVQMALASNAIQETRRDFVMVAFLDETPADVFQVPSETRWALARMQTRAGILNFEPRQRRH